MANPSPLDRFRSELRESQRQLRDARRRLLEAMRTDRQGL